MDDTADDARPVEVAPPGRLAREDRDSALTGATRSLQRRVLGLGVLTPPENAVKVPPVKPTKSAVSSQARTPATPAAKPRSAAAD